MVMITEIPTQGVYINSYKMNEVYAIHDSSTYLGTHWILSYITLLE